MRGCWEYYSIYKGYYANSLHLQLLFAGFVGDFTVRIECSGVCDCKVAKTNPKEEY